MYQFSVQKAIRQFVAIRFANIEVVSTNDLTFLGPEVNRVPKRD